MDIEIFPSRLEGSLTAPPSSLFLHKYLVLSALCKGTVCIPAPEISSDVAATIDCLRALGTQICAANDSITVSELKPVKTAIFNCRESGNTLRLIMPAAAYLCESALFTGYGPLTTQTCLPTLNILREHGCKYDNEFLPINISGGVFGNEFDIPAGTSAQAASALLLMLPLFPEGGSLTSPMSAAKYMQLTVNAMAEFGVTVVRTASGYSVPAGQHYTAPRSICVEGDWTNASYLLAGGAISGGVDINGLSLDSIQPDKQILDVLTHMGVSVALTKSGINVKSAALRAIDIDIKNFPNLAPVIAVLAAYAEGTSRIKGINKLPPQETARMYAIADGLASMGVQTTQGYETLEITGTTPRGASLCCCGDHRVAMALCIAAVGANGVSRINGINSIAKSYPGFVKALNSLNVRSELYR